MAIILSAYNVSAQEGKGVVYEVFASMPCPSDNETSTDNPMRQNYITVQSYNDRFIWGNMNTFYVYNKQVTHEGFKTITQYDFVDKHGQRGKLIYLYSENQDWYARNMFVISYDEYDQCMIYMSNDPKNE